MECQNEETKIEWSVRMKGPGQNGGSGKHTKHEEITVNVGLMLSDKVRERKTFGRTDKTRNMQTDEQLGSTFFRMAIKK